MTRRWPLVYTPVRARRGHLVHLAMIGDVRVTLCGRPCDGWLVDPTATTCRRCLASA